MSLHISSFMKKIEHGDLRYSNDNIREMVANYPEELEMARDIRMYISEYFHTDIPEVEEDYLAVLLISLKKSFVSGKIGVVVAAHGDSTASSMVQVVRQLLEVDQILAVDMPLDMSPKVAYEKVVAAVQKVDNRSGVLLLVDMGSLATFQERIQRETGINVRTLDMVTTPSVLEAARRASVLGNDLESVYDSLREFRGYGVVQEKIKRTAEKKRPKAILAICASGEGTAKQVRDVIEESLKQQYIKDVSVLTLSIVNLQQDLPKIIEDYQVVASTGVVDPKVNAPFISLERFINVDIDELIEFLLFDPNDDNVDLLDYSKEITSESVRKNACNNFISESVTFLNPEKITDILWSVSESIVEHYQLSNQDYSFQTNFSIHCSSMLERILLQRPVVAKKEDIEQIYSWEGYEWLHETLVDMGATVQLTIPLSEEYYIVEMIRYRL